MGTDTSDQLGSSGHEPADDRRTRRWALPLTGVAAALLTAAGLTGVGDAPHPTQTDIAIADHFREVDGAVLAAAPLGQLGAIAVTAFAFGLGRRLHRLGATAAAAALVPGRTIASGYLLLLQVIYTTVAYEVATSSPPTAKALFVATILAVPAFGLGVAIALAGAASGATATKLLPTWWSAVTAVGAALAAVALFSYRDSGFFSPDVQQQVVANVLLLWLLITAPATIRRRRAEPVR